MTFDGCNSWMKFGTRSKKVQCTVGLISNYFVEWLVEWLAADD